VSSAVFFVQQQTVTDPVERADGNTMGLEFLLTDLDLAMTFMDVAQTTGIEETVAGNHQNAHIAYDTVLRMLAHLTPTAVQQQSIDDQLAVLKARLIAVGKRFQTEVTN
jgi:hypothetical protein